MAKMGGFVDFLKRSGGRKRIVVIAALGVLLLLFASVISSLPRESEGEDIEALCSSVEGVGECTVMLSYAPDGETVVAVAVVCDGGDSVTVRHRLTELLSSFYGIGYHRISIEKSK